MSLRNSLRCLLQNRGIKTECFESVRTFMVSVPSSQKGIAIVDIHTTKLHGFFLMDQMKALGYNMTIIFLGHRRLHAYGLLKSVCWSHNILDRLQAV